MSFTQQRQIITCLVLIIKNNCSLISYHSMEGYAMPLDHITMKLGRLEYSPYQEDSLPSIFNIMFSRLVFPLSYPATVLDSIASRTVTMQHMAIIRRNATYFSMGFVPLLLSSLYTPEHASMSEPHTSAFNVTMVCMLDHMSWPLWLAQLVTCITQHYWYHMHLLSCPIQSPSSSKYVQK